MASTVESSIASLSDLDVKVKRPFRFFDLPYELRRRILLMVQVADKVIDLEFNAIRRVGIFLVSRQFHEEASDAFYSGNTFRLLPVNGPVHKKRTKPLIQRFAPRYRACLTKVELRLGPHWSKTPRCWAIDDELGLEDAHSLRLLRIFIEIDPSEPIFQGFRVSKEYYTQFCGKLLSCIISRLPNLQYVEFQAYPAVTKQSPLVVRLALEANRAQKKVLWGPGLKEQEPDEEVNRLHEAFASLRMMQSPQVPRPPHRPRVEQMRSQTECVK